MPPIILVNRDGAIGYHATDLGTILDRKRSIDPELSLYVVDQRQALHFEQVFRASDMAGYMPESTLEHLGFGTVNGADGKPYKTREGGILKLHELIAQADATALARMKEAELGADVSDGRAADIAHKVAVAAIKFSDLSNVRTTNYVFDLDRFISFEGKTGPYLLYAAVRIKSLARRAEAEGVTARADRGRARLPSARWCWRSTASTRRCAAPTTSACRTSCATTPTRWRRRSRASTPPRRSWRRAIR